MDIGEVTVDRRGVSLWVIRLTGEHDLSNASQLSATLDGACESGGSAIVDLCGCEFIDSTVIATLISARDRTREDDAQFAVVAPDGARSTAMCSRSPASTRFSTCVTRSTTPSSFWRHLPPPKPQQTPPIRHAMTPREVAQVQAELVQTKARLANARLRVHTYQRRVEQLQQILDEHDKAMTVVPPLRVV